MSFPRFIPAVEESVAYANYSQLLVNSASEFGRLFNCNYRLTVCGV